MNDIDIVERLLELLLNRTKDGDLKWEPMLPVRGQYRTEIKSADAGVDAEIQMAWTIKEGGILFVASDSGKAGHNLFVITPTDARYQGPLADLYRKVSKDRDFLESLTKVLSI